LPLNAEFCACACAKMLCTLSVDVLCMKKSTLYEIMHGLASRPVSACNFYRTAQHQKKGKLHIKSAARCAAGCVDGNIA